MEYCMYFSFFKPQDWRKRSVVRGRGFIQRFHKDCRKKVSDIWPWNCNFRFMTDLPFSGREAVPSALYFLCRARKNPRSRRPLYSLPRKK